MTRNRHDHDFYRTPALLTRTLLSRVQLKGNVLECCSGDGAIAQELEKHRYQSSYHVTFNVLTNDLVGQFCNQANVDVTQEASWDNLTHGLLSAEQSGKIGWNHSSRLLPFDWVITNPPFSKAHKIVPLAYKYTQTGIAMLLRLSYLEPCSNRAQWLQQHRHNLSNLIVFSPRPKFRSDTSGSDSVTVPWFVWRKNWTGETQVEFVND